MRMLLWYDRGLIQDYYFLFLVFFSYEMATHVIIIIRKVILNNQRTNGPVNAHLIS